MKSVINNNEKDVVYIITDVESTGCNQLSDRIFDIAFLFTDGAKVLHSYQSLINVDEKLVVEAKKNLGHIIDINVEAVAKAPSAKIVYQEIIELLEKWTSKHHCILVAHNIHFDYSMTSHDMSLVSEELKYRYQCMFQNNLLDTITLSKKLYPNLTSRSLNFLLQFFNISNANIQKRAKEGHGALIDCELLFDVFKIMLLDMPFGQPELL